MARPLVGQEAVTLRTFAVGSRGTDGRFTAGALTDTTIQASVQPVNGQELQTLPEGDRQRDWLKVYTLATLKTNNQHTQIPADRIVIDTIVYEVRQVWPWRTRAPLPHFKAFIVRLQEA